MSCYRVLISVVVLVSLVSVVNAVVYGMLTQYNDMCMANTGKPLACMGSSPGKLMCLTPDQMCDGLFECGDGSDEYECDYGTSTPDYSPSWGTAGGACPTPAQEPIGIESGIDELKPQFIEAHNYFRCLHGTPALTWSDDLQAVALAAVIASAASKKLTHQEDGGENLAYTNIDVSKVTGFGIVKAWYDERADYDFTLTSPPVIEPVGHFTQVVWRDSTTFGCDIAQEADGDWQYACEYAPWGNISPLFIENVPVAI